MTFLRTFYYWGRYCISHISAKQLFFYESASLINQTKTFFTFQIIMDIFLKNHNPPLRGWGCGVLGLGCFIFFLHILKYIYSSKIKEKKKEKKGGGAMNNVFPDLIFLSWAGWCGRCRRRGALTRSWSPAGHPRLQTNI